MIEEKKRDERPASLAAMQSLLHFDRVFTYTLLGVEAIVIFGKVITLPYGKNDWWSQCLAVLIIYWLASELRLNFGNSANKYHSLFHVILMTACAVVTVFLNGHMMGI